MMGMFDYIRCEAKLPVDGYNDKTFQTKDTPEQYLDLYRIDENGKLWHQAYDTEDRSDPNTTGLDALRGCRTAVNKRWEEETYTGEIRFYDFVDSKNNEGWIEFSAYFKDGIATEINLIEEHK